MPRHALKPATHDSPGPSGVLPLRTALGEGRCARRCGGAGDLQPGTVPGRETRAQLATHGQLAWMAGILVLCLACEGCNRFQHHPPVIVDAPPALWDNPMFVPVTDPEFVWNQLVDTLDDYFAIQKEERVRPIGNTLTEGRIETQPQIGATYLEPWRRDSMPGFERLQSTLQSIRRRATVRVIPSEGGYLIEVVVAKELEDVDRPEFYTIQGPSFRHDGSQVRGTERDRIGPVTLGWIALGRDIELEQRILQDVQARVAQPPSRMHP